MAFQITQSMYYVLINDQHYNFNENKISFSVNRSKIFTIHVIEPYNALAGKQNNVTYTYIYICVYIHICIIFLLLKINLVCFIVVVVV